MWALSLFILIIFSGNLFSMDYYSVDTMYVDNKDPTLKVRVSDQGVSKEKFFENTKKKYKLITSSGIVETDLNVSDEKGLYLFVKEIPRADEPILAISTNEKVTDVYIPKWQKLVKSKVDEGFLAELYKDKRVGKAVKGEFFLEIYYGESAKVSDDGDWKYFIVTIWNKERYQKLDKEKDYEKYNDASMVSQKASVLFYKGAIVKLFMKRMDGNSSSLDFIGTLKIDGKKHAMIRELELYSNLNEFTYLYEMNDDKVGKKKMPNLPVGVAPDDMWE